MLVCNDYCGGIANQGSLCKLTRINGCCIDRPREQTLHIDNAILRIEPQCPVFLVFKAIQSQTQVLTHALRAVQCHSAILNAFLDHTQGAGNQSVLALFADITIGGRRDSTIYRWGVFRAMGVLQHV